MVIHKAYCLKQMNKTSVTMTTPCTKQDIKHKRDITDDGYGIVILFYWQSHV